MVYLRNNIVSVHAYSRACSVILLWSVRGPVGLVVRPKSWRREAVVAQLKSPVRYVLVDSSRQMLSAYHLS